MFFVSQVEVVSHMINQDPPATCSSEIADAISKSAAALKLKTKRMVSRAYHDSLFMARLVLYTSHMLENIRYDEFACTRL